MAAPLRKSLDELRSQSTTLLENAGIITNLSQGGVARSLLEITNIQMADLYNAMDFQFAMSKLSTAAGSFLDLIGQSRGIYRTLPSQAVVLREDESLKFYSDDGVTPIKGLLVSNYIPQGTLITTADSNVTFSVSADTYPNDVQIEVFVPAVSQSTGGTQNVGRGVLVSHNLSGQGVSVVNTKAISTAQDIESDSNYRYRISRAVFSAAGATADAIRTAALSAPGVADVQIREFSDGTGTFELIAIPVGNDFAPGMLRLVESLVRRVVAYGTRFTVKSPIYVPVELVAQLHFTKAATANDKISIKAGARQAILNYIAAVDMGGTFVLNELTQRVMDVSDKIFDMKILLFRFKNENLVPRNVALESDELLRPSPDANNPISVV